jgi:hypothetical protein
MAYIDQYRKDMSCKIIRPVIRMKVGLVLHMAAENNEEGGK